MKKKMLILSSVLLVLFCAGRAMAYPVALSIGNFEVAGFYSLSASAVDSSGNPIDASTGDALMKQIGITYVEDLGALGDALLRQDTTGSPAGTASVYVIADRYIVVERTSWEWMKKYRIWEANSNVFLYPENWVEPEAGDDASPFLILGARPGSIPEAGEARAAFFDHLRNTWYADISASPVSEPSSLLLLGSAFMGLFVGRRFFWQ